MGLFSHFYIAPHVNQEWTKDKKVKTHHHNEESWVELFIDLTYVALFITLGSAIAKCKLSVDVLSHAALIFLMMFFFRLSVDNYSNRSVNTVSVN
jgi:low temperature requirement protein LtrA